MSSPENPEALQALMEHELYVQVCCESVKQDTSLKRGATWNESCICYLTSPVAALLTVKVTKYTGCPTVFASPVILGYDRAPLKNFQANISSKIRLHEIRPVFTF
eukprot:sb/3477931/